MTLALIECGFDHSSVLLKAQEFLPPKTFPKAGESLLPTLHTLQPTPVSPSIPKLSIPTNVSPEVLANWPETAATIVSNSVGGEHSSSLTALGDCLLSNNWIEAAHVWCVNHC